MNYEHKLLCIGESLNASIPKIKEAVTNHDDEVIKSLAVQQEECGAHMLDLNAAVPTGNEPEDLVWMVQLVQGVTELPLVLDSSSPEALQAALKVYQGGTPIISSITGEWTAGHEELLSLAVENSCGLVAMCMDKEGISPNAEKRFQVAEALIARTAKAGLKPENLYIDPLVMTISADTVAGAVFLNLLKSLDERFPEVHKLCGASNVSYGMPLRKLINHTFIPMLVSLGMDGFLVNVRDQGLMATFKACAALIGQDEWSMEYIRAFREGKLEAK